MDHRPPRAARAADSSGAQEWIAAREVVILAARWAISERMLRRLHSQGLLAASQGPGRGRGRGRGYVYPERVARQIVAIGEARQHGHKPAFIRHWVWWDAGGRLEDWELWRRDRLSEMDVQVSAWDLTPATDDEFPDDRERHMQEVARQMATSRLPGLPRPKLRHAADWETYVRLHTSLVQRDDLVDAVSAAATGEAAFDELQSILSQPVDGEPVAGEGDTLGTLFERGLGVPEEVEPRYVRGARSAALMGFVPHPRDARARLLAMTEDRATGLRNAVIGWSTLAGRGGIIRRNGLVAAQSLVIWDVLGGFFPQALEGPPPTS